MPNPFLLPVEQGGHHPLSDARDMRHPLPGDGMTGALSDVVLLAPIIAAEKPH